MLHLRPRTRPVAACSHHLSRRVPSLEADACASEAARSSLEAAHMRPKPRAEAKQQNQNEFAKLRRRRRRDSQGTCRLFGKNSHLLTTLLANGARHGSPRSLTRGCRRRVNELELYREAHLTSTFLRQPAAAKAVAGWSRSWGMSTPLASGQLTRSGRLFQVASLPCEGTSRSASQPELKMAHELAELSVESDSRGGSMTPMVAVCAVLCRRVGVSAVTHGQSLLR